MEPHDQVSPDVGYFSPHLKSKVKRKRKKVIKMAETKFYEILHKWYDLNETRFYKVFKMRSLIFIKVLHLLIETFC